MATILSRNSSTSRLLSLTKDKLAERAQQEKLLTDYPNSFESHVVKNQLELVSKQDEAQLQKLAKRNDAVLFNTLEIQRLGDNEQMVIKGDKVAISRIDSGEILYETTRRGMKLALKLPSRQSAWEQMEGIDMLKQVKGVPVALIKKEELFSTIRKAVKDYLEQQELANKEYEANVLAGNSSARQKYVERKKSIRESLHSDMDSIMESIEPEARSALSGSKPLNRDSFVKATKGADSTDWSQYDSHNLEQQNLLNHFVSQMNAAPFRM